MKMHHCAVGPATAPASKRFCNQRSSPAFFTFTDDGQCTVSQPFFKAVRYFKGCRLHVNREAKWFVVFYTVKKGTPKSTLVFLSSQITNFKTIVTLSDHNWPLWPLLVSEGITIWGAYSHIWHPFIYQCDIFSRQQTSGFNFQLVKSSQD